MAHFAKVLDGIVTQVIVCEEDFMNSYVDSTPGTWIQTSYNTKKGQHKTGGTPLRKNFAGIGYSYDETRDAFIPPKEFESWVLNEDTCVWESPVALPDDALENGGSVRYTWNEETQSWDAVTE